MSIRVDYVLKLECEDPAHDDKKGNYDMFKLTSSQSSEVLTGKKAKRIVIGLKNGARKTGWIIGNRSICPACSGKNPLLGKQEAENSL